MTQQFIDEFNRFFRGDASLDVIGDEVKIQILSRTMVVKPLAIIGIQSTGSLRLERSAIRYNVMKVDDEWRVEAMYEESEGWFYVAIFSGPNGQWQAEEYAAFKNARIFGV